MVHVFDCLDRIFMLDVESGSLFEIDSHAKKIIEKLNSLPSFSGGEFKGLNDDFDSETLSEIKSLIDKGVLYSDEGGQTPPVYSPRVKALCLNVSHLCNLRCKYCFADGGDYGDVSARNMPLAVATAAVDFLIERSGNTRNLEVDFFGGEPLLNLDVVKQTVAYIRECEKKYDKVFKLTITTNAYALNDEITEFFNQEMYNVVVSIDGRKDVHNSVRKTAGGKDSFDVILKNALEFKKKRKGLYYIRGTYTALNKDFAKDVLYLNDLGFDSLSIEPVVLEKSHQLALKESDIPALKAEYDSLAVEYIKRRKENPDFVFFHFMADIYNSPCKSKVTRGCGAGCEYLAVSPDGSIYPCHQFDGKDEYKIGSVLDKTFSDAVPKEFAKTSIYSKEGCTDCWAKYYCSGGCNANAITLSGNIDKPEPVSCELMKKRIECALAVNCIENS